MSDTTRPHPRVAEYMPRGRRVSVGQGTLFLPDRLRPTNLTLLVHFHGAQWVIEHHVSRLKRPVAVLAFQLGSGSGVYGKAFTERDAFARAVADASRAASEALGKPIAFTRLVLTSFSAGYGAIRAILRHQDQYARVSAVLLADSLHASYAAPATGAPRAQDLAVNLPDLDVFLTLAADAAAGRKQFVVLHSEVFPGTYASTTETADALLAHVGLRRRPVLRAGFIGMQQLSETGRGKFVVAGYAGNSAPDHMDHLYALGEALRRWLSL